MCRKEIPTDDPDLEAIRNHEEGEEDSDIYF
jgi:hypothetical protein